MGSWIKSEKTIEKEEINKIKESFKKNKVVSAYATNKTLYIRYKPLRNLKSYNINPEILDDLINFFINFNGEKSFSTDEFSMLISLGNKNTILVLKDDKEKKVFYNCDKDLSQIGLDI